MDWSGSIGMYANDKQPYDGGVDEEEEEDFYGYAPNVNGTETVNGYQATPGASHEQQIVNPFQQIASNFPTTAQTSIEAPASAVTQTPEQKHLDSVKKAEELKKKIIAKRQSTPIKAMSRPDTPSKVATAQPSKPEVKQPEVQMDSSEPSSDIFGLEALLAEGKAAAEANLKQNEFIKAEDNVTKSNEEPITNHQNSKDTLQDHITNSAAGATNHEQAKPKRSAKLTDAYYADLSIWLEMTGYHDVDYRNSKLRTYKERKALEEEASRIAQRLEKLRQDEQATIESLRAASAHPTNNMHPPPALPALMPTLDAAHQAMPSNKATPAAPAINGTKRDHSPEPVQSTKAIRREESNGFRIRGANESPNTRAAALRRPSSPSPPGLAGRVSYPEARRSSPNDHRPGSNRRREERDPSLERRMGYYRHNGEPSAAAWMHDRYDAPRENGRDYEERGRLGYSTVNRPLSPGDRRGYQHYRGSAGLDLKKGGVRYFMIKSWNHDNVKTAMRDSLWATQVKNEQLLTDAFKTSRHVVLVFSVNKSMAFQGYALMTSPPDPTLPKPSFCAKLNWGTSPAFSLRWLSTTPVHFKYVGHLKNTMNIDDRGSPMAVLVGKDGQEISSDAAMGLIGILDEAEEVEGKSFGGSAGGGGGW